MGQVFISYSNRDRDRVAELVGSLKGLGYSIWWDEDLTPGGDWDLEIQRALEQSRTVLVIWSESAMASREVRAEATYALNENKLLPVRIDPVKIWARYNIVQYKDVLNRPPERDPNWPAVIGHLRSRVEPERPPQAAPPPLAGSDGAPPVPPQKQVKVSVQKRLSDAPVLPMGIASSAVFMIASGMSVIAWLGVPLLDGPDTMIPLWSAAAFGTLGILTALTTLLRPSRMA
jgi:hypothetical protein